MSTTEELLELGVYRNTAEVLPMSSWETLHITMTDLSVFIRAPSSLSFFPRATLLVAVILLALKDVPQPLLL